MFGVYIPLIENPYLLNKTVDDNNRWHSMETAGFDIVGHYGSRVTFRYFDVQSDAINQDPPFLPLIYYRRFYGVMDPFSEFQGEFTSTLFNYITGYPKPDWSYSEPGDISTSNSAGGYAIVFEKGNQTANNLILENWMLNNAPLNALLGIP